MRADAVPLLALFEKKLRLEVPMFQRQYVWSEEQQWEPLWEDISRKFVEFLEGRKEAPVHFLGAMVLDQKKTPVAHVEKRQVIDGQQRLTTLQIFLSALRDFCREYECEELAKELDSYTLNRGMMADPDVDKFKVWPTQVDRSQFVDVVGGGSRAAIEAKHPVVKKKRARKPEPRPRMVEAYLYFSDQIREFFLGTDEQPPMAADAPLTARVDESFQALKSALKVVAIDLEQDDDAQVIFETLNARGEPLLPADLLRNYIFLRAARTEEPQERLYEQYWRRFDDEFWRTEVVQGRLTRPRSDLFMQHFLTSRRLIDIPVKHLFVEYRFWIEKEKPFTSVEKELETIAAQGDEFRRILAPEKADVIHGLATFLESFDIRTAYPLLLALFNAKISNAEWSDVSSILESYLLRRAVLGWTTKAYNRIFLNATKDLAAEGMTSTNLRRFFSGLSGDTSAWPTDEQFRAAWNESQAYYVLNNAKLVHVLRRLSNSFGNNMNERITIDCPLTVEHILPQGWIEHWRLPSGEQGFTDDECSANDGHPITKSTRDRNRAVQTIGNLTILTQELNSSVSNSAWDVKKPALLNSSLLPINQHLHRFDKWDETTITERGRMLFEKAITIWPEPE